jgi:hypothetical protein
MPSILFAGLNVGLRGTDFVMIYSSPIRIRADIRGSKSDFTTSTVKKRVHKRAKTGVG